MHAQARRDLAAFAASGSRCRGLSVAGNGRITRERFLRERPEVLGADLIAGLGQSGGGAPAGVDHMSVSATSRTIAQEVSRRAQNSHCGGTTIFKNQARRFSLASIRRPRTYGC